MAIYNKGIDVLHSSLSGSQDGAYIYGPSSGSNAITSLMLCNNSLSDITVSLYAVQSGYDPYNQPETTIVSKLVVPSGETVSFDQEKLVLGAGDSLQATASVVWSAGLGVSATVSTLPV